MNKNGVTCLTLMLLAVAGCAEQESALMGGAGGEPQAPELTNYRLVAPIAASYGLASKDSGGIYLNFTYRYEGQVRHGFLRATETGRGRIFCPTMVQTAINLKEPLEVAWKEGSGNNLYDDLVLGIRYGGRECPAR